MEKEIAKIIIFLGLILVIFGFYNINKINCEKQGGVYIFEFGNKGSMCHFKND